MNYLLKNNRRGGGASKQVFAAVAAIAIAILLYLFAPNFVNNTLLSFAKPVWKTRDYVKEKYEKVYALFADKERLAARNKILEFELDEAKIALHSLEVYKRENDNLKSVLLGRESDEKRTLASIMAKPNHSLYDTLVLDVGLQNGVAAGDRVLAGDFVLGTIREAYENYSKATLLSSSGEVTRVLIGDTNISAEALGKGSGNFMVKVPKEIAVTEGDIVRMPGLNPKFFGTVLDIEQTETSTFQVILFHLPININHLRWVEVVKSE